MIIWHIKHPLIWNNPPSDVAVPLGQPATLGCSATVGQQYNTVSMEPVHAAWIRLVTQIAFLSKTKNSSHFFLQHMF